MADDKLKTVLIDNTNPGHVRIILLYFIISVIFTYPLIIQIGTHIPALRIEDSPIYLWNAWNFKASLLTPPHNPFIAHSLLYPFEPDLTFNDYTIVRSVMVNLLSIVFNQMASFNIVTLLMFTFSGYGAYLLTLKYINNPMAAFISGFIFSFCPFKLRRLAGHFVFIDSVFIPFFFLFFFKTMEKKNIKNAVISAIFFILIGYSSYYYMIFSFIVALLIILYHVFPVDRRYCIKKQISEKLRSRLKTANMVIGGITLSIVTYMIFFGKIENRFIRIRNLDRITIILIILLLINIFFKYKIEFRSFFSKFWKNTISLVQNRVILNLIVFSIVVIVLFSPVIYQTIARYDDYMNISFNLDGSPRYLPGPANLFLFTRTSSINNYVFKINRYSIEQEIYLGIILAGLFIYSLIFLRKNMDLLFWKLITILFILFALGPFLKLGKCTLLELMPYDLVSSIPILRGALFPSRYIIIAMLAGGIVAAYAINHLMREMKNNKKYKKFTNYLPFILLFLITVEYISVPVSTHRIDVPEFYKAIGKDKEQYSILELPFYIIGKGKGTTEVVVEKTGLYQYYQTVHQKNLLTGYLDYISDDIMDYHQRNNFLHDILILQDRKIPPRIKIKIIADSEKGNAQQFFSLFDIRYLVLYKNEIKGNSFDYLIKYLDNTIKGKSIIVNDRYFLVYRILTDQSRELLRKNLIQPEYQIALISGWSDYVKRDSDSGRWIKKTEAKFLFPYKFKKDLILRMSMITTSDLNILSDNISLLVNNKYIDKEYFRFKKIEEKNTLRLETAIPKSFLKRGPNIFKFRYDSNERNKNTLFINRISFYL